MKQFRTLALVSAVAAALGAQALVGSAQQAPAAAPANPLDSLYFRPIGPAAMSGRIADVAVYEADPATYYVGTAHGGVWKTTNNGTTFEAQFQDQGLMSIGDVTVSQHNPDLVWIGTGESNNRQSTSWGNGVYKSTDGGKTYTHMGLPTSRHINRIVIDPRDNNTVFVAATGSLWGPGGERGVFKTTDAGKTWKQVLKVDEDTGANELVMDPNNHKVLYASMYQRRRTACCFNGGGTGSGIFKSTDGGETWTKLKGGVLDGPLGRIAFDVYRKDSNILYAVIEGPQQQQQGGGRGGGGGQGVNDNPTGFYKSTDAGKTWTKVNNANPRPMYFSQVRIDPNDSNVVYLGGVDLHQTLDGGKTMDTSAASRTHSDHHAIWINPANSNHVLIGNDGGLAVSYDKSKTWVFLPNLPVGLFYHVSVDNAIPYNVCGGMQDNYNWCGPSAVRGSAGIANFHWKTLQGGDGFVVLQDPSDYRIAYSESQDGNMTRVDRVTGETISIRPQPPAGESYRWHWDTPMLLSPHNARTLYSAANKVFRSDDRGLSWTVISPDLTESPSRDDIVTMGVKGSEIRFSRNDGIRDWPTIVALAESAKRPGLIYAGTDDGNVSVTRDGGKKWDNVTSKIPGLPEGIYVSEVVPSRFTEGVVYATFDGHRLNNFTTYIYASSDFGQTWRPINANLTDEVARTLTEDTRNQDVLYLGTETGLFVSLDRGKSWQRLKANLPTVRIDEITLHPRDNAMVLATHGRTIWILDHLEPIQEMAAARAATTDADLFTPPAFAWYQRPARDRNYEFWGDQTFYGQNPPQAARLSWYLKKPAASVALKIADAAGREVREISGPVLAEANKAGINMACWDLRVQPAPALAGGGGGGGRQGGGGQGGNQNDEREPDPFGAGCSGGGGGGGGRGGGGGTAGPFVMPGTYNVTLLVDGKAVETKPLKVIADPEVVLTEAERKQLFDRAMELHDLQTRATAVAAKLAPLNQQAQAAAKELAGRSDVPAAVKSQFEAFKKELDAVVPKFITQGGGGGQFGGFGGGGGAPSPNVLARIGQAKGGMMGGMVPTENTTKAYAEAKTMTPPAIAEANAVLAKAPAVSAALAQHKIKLEVR